MYPVAIKNKNLGHTDPEYSGRSVCGNNFLIPLVPVDLDRLSLTLNLEINNLNIYSHENE